MKKLIVLSILCLAFTGCGSKETNTDNVTTETETQIEVEIEVTESEVIETETEQEVNDQTTPTEEQQEVIDNIIQDQAEQTGSTYDEAYEDIFGPDDGMGDMLTADDPRISDYEYSDDNGTIPEDLLDLADGKKFQ